MASSVWRPLCDAVDTSKGTGGTGLDETEPPYRAASRRAGEGFEDG